MSRHELKTWPEPFAALRDLKKRCEVRREDWRRFAEGDELVLREFDPCVVCLGAGTTGEVIWTLMGTKIEPECQVCHGAKGDYTGREAHVRVTHVQRGFGLPSGLVVMSVEPFLFMDAPEDA